MNDNGLFWVLFFSTHDQGTGKDMRHPKRHFFLLVLVSLCALSDLLAHQTTILISFDGFRHDYVARMPDGVFKDMAEHGCKAEALIPVNPTKTFPNHWSIATGLYPEHHGIIDNHFYDRALRDSFSMPRTESSWWLGEPIWITAERHGVAAYTYFWPGSQVVSNGRLPSKWLPYNGKRLFEDRVDSMVTWAAQEHPPGLIVGYFEVADDFGHKFGPNGKEMELAFKHVEDIVSRLVRGLTTRGIVDSTNIIILSDHGMAEVPAPESSVPITPEMLGTSPSMIVMKSNPNLLVYGITADTARAIAKRLNSLPELHVQALPGAELPDTWKINAPNRLPDLYVQTVLGRDLYMDSHRVRKETGGSHGYDNKNTDMFGIFVATGPSIRNGQIPALSVIDVYPIVCALLHIPPAPNDGNANRINDVVRR